MFTTALRQPIARRQALLALRSVHNSAPRAATAAAQPGQINSYIPGGPVLPGTVNDATSFPEPNKAKGSHHWQFERLLSVALVPMTVYSFALTSSPHVIFDGILGASLIIHSHIGFDSSLVDYLHKRKFPVLGPICGYVLKAATAGALWGLYEFNTNDVGLTEIIRRTWTA